MRGSLFALACLSAWPSLAQTICSIQGSGTGSPFNGQQVITSGIVTAVFSGSGSIQGFFIEDPDCDTDPLTSNGLFVYQPNNSGIQVGQRVSVSATVMEFQTLTELTSVTNIQQLGTGVVVPTDVGLPLSSGSVWERYEGMLLRFPGMLTVTGNDDWASYGELVLAHERLLHATERIDPNDANPDGITVGGFGNVPAVNAAEVENVLGTILLDDGRTTTYPDPPPLIDANGTLRCGSRIQNLTAVLHYLYSSWRLQPAGAITMLHDVRPTLPPLGGTLRFAGWNVRNYWTSLGGFGAENAQELGRQRTKLLQALLTMDADAIVLCELEDNDLAWTDLLAGLNALYGTTVYGAVEDDAGFGTKSAIFYKSSVLSPVTPLYSLYSSDFERAHITQGFQLAANDARFLLSGAHLRSKLCDNATGANQDLGDGQGCYNARRIDQAVLLSSHWADVRSSTGIEAQLIIGDLNAYSQEDPIDMLRVQGLVGLLPDNIDDHYSYRYQDRFGAIDHAFATPAMEVAVAGMSPWAINADEPPDFDYRDDNIAFYQPNAFRSSDHDPVLVGVDEQALLTGIDGHDDPGGISFGYDPVLQQGRWQSTGAMRVQVMDVLGRNLRSAATGTVHTEDFSALPTGTYVWQCTTLEGANMSGRFVR